MFSEHSVQLLLGAVLPECGPFTVHSHPQSGRHCLYVGQDEGGVRYLVKRTPPSAGGAAAETWFYGHLEPRFEYAPKPLAVVEDQHVVVLEYLDGADSVSDMARRDPRAGLAGLVDAASPVARLHSLAPEGTDGPLTTTTLAPLDPVPLDLWNSSSDGARTVIALLQGRTRLAEAYRSQREPGGPRTFVHGDIKVDNILYLDGRPYLIDWELAGIGTPTMDLGAAVGSMVCLWVDNLAADADASIATWVRDAPLQWDDVRDAARRFVSTYLTNLTAAVDVPVGDIVRAAATWVVARTWADASQRHAATPWDRLRLITANSLIERPKHLMEEASS